MRRAPGFWWPKAPTITARLLQPAGMAYGAMTARRMAWPGLVLPVPVLCIGNLVAGGAGKTPTVLALAMILQAVGHRPAVLSRGYGRRVSRKDREIVIRVDPLRHDAEQVGDEPLLLAAAAPTYVAADRRSSGWQAVAEGATILVLDDSLQNPTLAKTLSVAVVDGAAGIGNGLCIPAGPLRAPVAGQWPFVHALCVIGGGQPGDDVAAFARSRGTPVLHAHLRPDPAAVARLAGRPVLAFAGIGRPEKFFATLEGCGLALRSRRAFPDHHRFTDTDCATLLAEAEASQAQLVTTTKDRTRLPADFPAVTLPVTLDFEDLDLVRGLLQTRLPAPGRDDSQAGSDATSSRASATDAASTGAPGR